MDSLKDKLMLIIRESSEIFKRASDFLTNTRKPLYAVNMLGSAILYHKKWVPVGEEFPIFIGADYDIIQLLFLESSFVRGIRYSGTKDLRSYMFSVEKLKLGAERRLLFPTFITHGGIQKVESSADMLSEKNISALHLLFHQPKPFVFSEEIDGYGRVSFVISSPLTGVELMRESRRCIVAPFLALAQISFRRSVRERSGYIFCYPKRTKYVRADLRLFLYRIEEDGVATQTSDWFPVLVLKSAIKSSEELRKAYKERGEVTGGVLLAIDSDEGYAVSINAKRVLRRLPGALVLMSMRSYVPEYSLLVSADIIERAMLGGMKSVGPPNHNIILRLGIPKTIVDDIRRWLTKNTSFSVGLPLISSEKLVNVEDGYLSSLAPPLLALNIWHGVDIDELREQQGIMGLLQESVRTVGGYMNALRAWEVATEGYKRLIRMFGLFIPV